MPDMVMDTLMAGAASQVPVESYPVFAESFRKAAKGKLSEAEIVAFLRGVEARMRDA